jgi:hypothetical protein
MRIAVVLSGTIRFPHQSLATLKLLRDSGNEVDVYIHTWKHVEDTVGQSWSHKPPLEPTKEIIDWYNPVSTVIDDWMETKPQFVLDVERWRDECDLRTFTHYGMPGMWYSLSKSYGLIDNPTKYDMILRLRFDMRLIDNPLNHLNQGWIIPEAVDFGGINDMVGWWYGPNKNNMLVELESYYNVYPNIGNMIKMGVEYHPEGLLKKSMDLAGVVPSRPLVRYKFHDD